jgi:hypothetical protein
LRRGEGGGGEMNNIEKQFFLFSICSRRNEIPQGKNLQIN